MKLELELEFLPGRSWSVHAMNFDSHFDKIFSKHVFLVQKENQHWLVLLLLLYLLWDMIYGRGRASLRIKT